MFEITSASVSYRRVGFVILLLNLCLFFYGFPPFRVGLWVQAEPVALGMYILAYVNCAWLAFGIAKSWLLPVRTTPLWWCLVLWIAWQLIPLFFALTPWRSWFGPPEMGEGTSWYVAMLLIAMLAYPYLQLKAYRTLLWQAVFAIVALLCLLQTFVPRDEAADALGIDTMRWVTARFAKDLPFMAGYGWVAFMCWARPLKKYAYIVLAACVCAVLFVSQNRCAIAFMGAALVASALPIWLHHARARRFLYPGRNWKILACIGCALPFVWVAFCANIATLEPAIDRLDVFEKAAGISDHFSLSNKDGTIGGRIPFLQVAMSTMQHEPMRWLVGGGWGRFTDDTYKYALVDGVYVYKDGTYQPNWEMLYDVPVVHCHSQPIEALLSLGLPGMMLWFGIPLLATWYLPKRRFWMVAPMLVALIMLSFFWFEALQDVPFHALALAALCGVSTRHTHLRLRSDITALVLACTCLVMGWTAWQQREAIAYAQNIRAALVTSSEYKEAWLTEDTKRGGDRLRQSALMYEFLISQNIKQQPLDDSERAWYMLFLNATHDYALSPHSNPHSASTEMWLAYKLFGEFGIPSAAPLQAYMFPRIPDAVLLVAGKAPLRDELATPLLKNLPVFMRSDRTKQIDYLRRLLAVAPDHRGALWVLGHMLGNEEGEAMIRRAVALHVERVYPVTDAELTLYNQKL